MLAGTPPFTGPTPQVITHRHTKDPPLPVRTVRPDVPAVMEGALFRALAKSPSERFSTAGEFSAALRGEVGAIDPASLSFSGPIPKPSFWSELKRRHVYHVGAGYIFLFFALLQIVDVVFPALNFADWADTLVVVVGLAGFPIALLLAWIYELTPRGIQRTQAIKTQPDGDA